jgi:tetratricopeptide (TPR) repeat protein
MLLAYTGRYVEAQQRGDPGHTQQVSSGTLLRALAADRPSDLRIWETGLEVAVRSGQRFEDGWSRALAGGMWRQLGDPAQAERLLRDADDDGPHPSTPLHRPLLLSELTISQATTGRPNEAAATLGRLSQQIETDPDGWRGRVVDVHAAQAAVHAALREYDEADVAFDRAVRGYQQWGLAWSEADALRRWGHASTMRGDNEQGRKRIEAALERYHQIGAGRAWIDAVAADLARL